ncbi:MAG TPA: hypothetical protein VFZ65_04425 [Planctomycetota bacterium]|nr:hypothetical protein [Planctomycetota bacterium]
MRGCACLLVLLLAGASCAAPGPRPAALVLRWRIEPDGGGGELLLREDGAGVLGRWSDEPRARSMQCDWLDASPVRQALVASAAERLGGQPRWLHASATSAGPRVAWQRNGQIVHESCCAMAPPLAELVLALAATNVQLGLVLPQLLDSAPATAPRFAFSPGDDPDRLAAILEKDGPDVPLRHLAARIAIEVRAFAIVPRLRRAFLRSLAADGLGDYFLASALLRLGDLVGIARVADERDSSRPDWAAEAEGDLAACLPAEAIEPPTGLLDWMAAHGARLAFRQDTARYTIPGGPDAGSHP